MVGPNGLEPSTSSVSRKRSNQLSYGPVPAVIFYVAFILMSQPRSRNVLKPGVVAQFEFSVP
jgi:hypothetical protein